MSIIHDALKKTQNNLNNNQDKDASHKMNTENPTPNNTNPPPPPNPMVNIYDKLHKKPDIQNPPHPKSPNKKNNPNNETQGNPVMTFFTIIFCLLIIAGAGWFIYQYYAQNMEKTGVDLKKVLTIKPQKLYILGTPKTPRPKPVAKVAKVVKEENNLPSNTIILSGITMMGEKRVALINNEIYQLGESVQGKKIVSITIEKVELEDSTGNITTLKVKGF